MPEGYRALVTLDGGGVLACKSLSDCGTRGAADTWLAGPGCSARAFDRPISLVCDGSSTYVMPDGHTKPLPADLAVSSVVVGTSNRVWAHEKARSTVAQDGPREGGVVLLDERLEVVARFEDQVVRVFPFKDGEAEVSLKDGSRGIVSLDGSLRPAP